MELNASQLRAISHGSGPCLILAGPGSGKTTVIIRRIQNLINVHHVRPEHILAVTFSRSAANEMAGRFASEGGSVTFGTLHSIFLKILNAESTGKLNLISERQRRDFIKSEIEKYSLPCESAEILCDELLLQIGRVKSGQLDICSAGIYSGKAQFGGRFPGIFTDYCLYLRRSGLIDFDDMISNCRRLLMQRPDVLSRWQARYRYILIDEFQDVSPAQYETLKLLAGPQANVFAVGDDDQSIYGFRGAGADIMHRFASDYPSAIRILLDQNYRCPSLVQEASLKIISENTGRFEKALLPVRAGGKVSLEEFEDRRAEYESIIAKIRELQRGGWGGNTADHTCRTCSTSLDSSADSSALSSPSIAVLFRNNEDSSLFIRMLEDAGITFTCKGKKNSFTEHFAVQDILAYMKVGMCLTRRLGRSCRKDLLRIINRPVRYIRRESLVGNIEAAAGAARGSAGAARDSAGAAPSPRAESSDTAISCIRSMEYFYRSNQHMESVISQLKKDLFMIADLAPTAAIIYICRVIGYENWLREYCSDKHLDPGSCIRAIDELTEYAESCNNICELLENIDRATDPTQAAMAFTSMTGHGRAADPAQAAEALTSAAGQSQIAKTVSNTAGKAQIANANLPAQDLQARNLPDTPAPVQIMTMHAAKGMEFDVVFLPDSNDSIIPNKKAVKEADVLKAQADCGQNPIEEERRLFYVAMTRARSELHISWVRRLHNRQGSPTRFISSLISDKQT